MSNVFFRYPMSQATKRMVLMRFNRYSAAYEAAKGTLPQQAEFALARLEATDRAVYDSMLCLTPSVIPAPPIFPVSPWPSPDKPSDLVLTGAKFLASEMLVHNINAFAPRVFSFLPAFPEIWPYQKLINSWQDPRAWNFSYHGNRHKVVMWADYMDRGYLCSQALAFSPSAGRLEAVASALAQGAETGLSILPNQHRPHDVRKVVALRLDNP
jgi:hypothetical protein